MFVLHKLMCSGLKHPCVVGLVGLCLNPLCIVTEFVPNGDLFEYIHSKKPLDLPLVLKIAFDVASAMAFMHGSTPPQLHRFFFFF